MIKKKKFYSSSVEVNSAIYPASYPNSTPNNSNFIKSYLIHKNDFNLQEGATKIIC